MSTLRMALETLLQLHQPSRQAISVLLTDDAEIRELNRTWRNLDEATDVLSWPAPEIPGGILGDIAISVDTAERQAKARKRPTHEEVALLGVHGGLHLLGWDDLTENDQQDMLTRMREVADACGIPMEREWQSLPHPGEEDHDGRA